MNLRKYTVEELKTAVKNSSSYRQTLIKLKVAAYGGNYEVLKKAIKHFNCDTSHFTGQGWSRGKTCAPKRKLSEYLSNSFPIQSHKLRKRLLKEGVFKHVCSACKLEDWMNQPIPLELDHISGDNKDNSLSNLRLLCPNCHAQTPTYRGKNKRKS